MCLESSVQRVVCSVSSAACRATLKHCSASAFNPCNNSTQPYDVSMKAACGVPSASIISCQSPIGGVGAGQKGGKCPGDVEMTCSGAFSMTNLDQRWAISIIVSTLFCAPCASFWV